MSLSAVGYTNGAVQVYEEDDDEEYAELVEQMQLQSLEADALREDYANTVRNLEALIEQQAAKILFLEETKKNFKKLKKAELKAARDLLQSRDKEICRLQSEVRDAQRKVELRDKGLSEIGLACHQVHTQAYGKSMWAEMQSRNAVVSTSEKWVLRVLPAIESMEIAIKRRKIANLQQISEEDQKITLLKEIDAIADACILQATPKIQSLKDVKTFAADAKKITDAAIARFTVDVKKIVWPPNAPRALRGLQN